MSHIYVSQLTTLFQEHADPHKAAGAEKYMRNRPITALTGNYITLPSNGWASKKNTGYHN